MPTKKKPPAKGSVRENIDVAREELHAIFAKQVERLDLLFNPKEMQARLLEIMVKERREVVMAVLGIEKSFGRLELNNKNNPIRDHLLGHANSALKSFLTDVVTPMLLKREKTLLSDPNIRKSIQDEFDHAFRYRLNEKVQSLAANMADAAFQELGTELLNQLKISPNARTG